ncbi:MAG: MBL fold metallo-hydrolase [Phycisphaerales bacterium]
MDVRVISIGALSGNPIWNERGAVRMGHATTTLVRADDATILVDPGLPAQALVARLHERTGLKPSDITHVFLTSFSPECRQGIAAFESARWLIAEREREAVGVPLAQGLARLAESAENALAAGDEPHEDLEETRRIVEHDVAVLQRCAPAPDKIAGEVALFPLPGVTPGLCGLLIPGARHTTLIAGDAVPTVDHLEQGKILPDCEDREQAQESFAEAIEIADLIVCGRDNIAVNPTRRPF